MGRRILPDARIPLVTGLVQPVATKTALSGLLIFGLLQLLTVIAIAILANNRVVFNIKGNDYTVVAMRLAQTASAIWRSNLMLASRSSRGIRASSRSPPSAGADILMCSPNADAPVMRISDPCVARRPGKSGPQVRHRFPTR